jgi:lysophospholipid acyltransferase (LPLAT)-like uncharacterized protein
MITQLVTYFLSVPKQKEKMYQFSSLENYSFKERLLIRILGFAFYVFTYLIGKTVRFEVEGWENLQNIERDRKIPILAFWHNRIFLATYYFRFRGIIVMSSQSFDSEYVARFIQRFGFGIVKGSSTRGGVGGLVEMIRLTRKGFPMGFSVDGPKGPVYEAKTGVLLLAKKTENPVLAFSVEAENYWTIKSWDKLQIPKPFTRAKVFITEPVNISNDTNDSEMKNRHLELQKKLDDLVALGEQWRGSNK